MVESMIAHFAPPAKFTPTTPIQIQCYHPQRNDFEINDANQASSLTSP